MAGNVVNLNRFKKKKQREEKAKQANVNRVKHGRNKAQKEGERADRERAARLLEGHKLDETVAPSEEPKEPEEPIEK